MISFNIPICIESSFDYMKQTAANHHMSGDGPFTKRCHEWICDRTGSPKALLTVSGTAALEMAAALCDIGPGDEVIMPSFTFSSTANAFVGRGATPVFVDIRPDTMNIDETKIEQAITDRTKAICVVHYAGVSCDMDVIMEIARAHGLKVIEDAAQCLMSSVDGKALGTIGDFGCLSFHESKNYSMGEGGCLLIRDEKYALPAEILREKGTNRSQFYRGQVDKYSWMDYGSSYIPSELNAAYLWSQLEVADMINEDRLSSWDAYREAFEPYAERGVVELPVIPDGCEHNAHIFYLKLPSPELRDRLIEHLRAQGIQATFHYVPLHSAPAGLKYGRFSGEDVFTTAESARLVRLPLYYGLTSQDRQAVIDATTRFLDEVS